MPALAASRCTVLSSRSKSMLRTSKPVCASRGALRVRAELNTPNPDSVKTMVDKFLQRYDVLSTGMGALAVTGYCYMRGQDPWTALSITISATAFALIVNELCFANQRQQ